MCAELFRGPKPRGIYLVSTTDLFTFGILLNYLYFGKLQRDTAAAVHSMLPSELSKPKPCLNKKSYFFSDQSP